MVEGGEHVDRSLQEKWAGVSIADQLVQLMKDQGLSKTEAVKAVCKLRDLPREVVYQIATQIKWEEIGSGESMDQDEGLD